MQNLTIEQLRVYREIRMRNSARIEKRMSNRIAGLIGPSQRPRRKKTAIDDVEELLEIIEAGGREMSLEQFTEKQLKDELSRREAERARKIEEERQRRSKWVVDHTDALLELCQSHDRTSCSDNDAQNYGRCRRCTLLRIKAEEWHDWSDMTFDLSMDLHRQF